MKPVFVTVQIRGSVSCPCCGGKGRRRHCAKLDPCSQKLCPGPHRSIECEACNGNGQGAQCSECRRVVGFARAELVEDEWVCDDCRCSKAPEGEAA